MARRLYPHHRHINFDTALYEALNQVARWRRCSLAAFVRDSVEVAARADYQQRGVPFPVDHEEPLPGQLELVPTGPVGDPGVPFTPPYQPDDAQSARLVDSPEGVQAVRGFLSLGHGTVPLSSRADTISASEGQANE
jgi:hypothetical protein